MTVGSPVRLSLLLGLWLLAVVGGLAALFRYEGTPGKDPLAPRTWPAASAPSPDRSRPTLLMFVHPECPCTRASLNELSALVRQSHGRFQVIVPVLDEAAISADPTQTELWSKAAAIPEVQVWRDRSGREASRFHAETSGSVVLYSPEGRLLFSGGITAARGHVGDNSGRNALLALADGAVPASARTPVFGCRLFDTCPSTTPSPDEYVHNPIHP